tara:strand:- start:2576 stop:3040 length:465 start_codon:yes stop_codon:yes gene_type:complete
MKLLLDRYSFGDDSTLGTLYLVPDGRKLGELCYILEDERRDAKVAGETCIPVGVYQVKYRNEGGMTQRYAAKFGDWHRGMLWLQDVVDFTFVYIHIGNTDDDTDGCLLTGTTATQTASGNWVVNSSRDAYEKVYGLIADTLDTGEDVVLMVRER